MVNSITRRRFLTQTGSVALAAGVGGTLLEACGGGSGSSSSGPVTLTYGWWSNGPSKDNAMKDWLGTFTKANPNIIIKPEILSWGDYWSKLQTTVAGGNAWDIVGMAGGNAAPYFDQGALLDLSQFSDLQDATKNLLQSAVQMTNWKGKQYALPVGIYVLMLGYNKSLLQKAGIPFPDPTTPMEFSHFMEIGAKLSIKSGSQYSQYAININDLDTLYANFILMEGGQVYDTPVNPKKLVLTDPANAAAALKGIADYQNLFTQNLAVPYAQMGNGAFGAGDIDSLLTNKVAFSRVVLGDFNQIVQQNLTTQIGVTPLFAINGKQVTSGNANSFGIFANSKHPNEAWTFIKWATSAGQRGFGQVSDIPADNTASADMGSYIQPAAFTQTLIACEKNFVPEVMTPNAQYSTDIGNILTDLANGKITPAQGVQQIQTKGQADISSAS
jgi:multiple sugar transport system substrate-binding protein